MQRQKAKKEKEESKPFKPAGPTPTDLQVEALLQSRPPHRRKGVIVNCYKCLKMLYLQEVENMDQGFMRDFIPTHDQEALKATIAQTRQNIASEKAKGGKGSKGNVRKYENQLKRQLARLADKGWNRRDHAMIPLGIHGPGVIGMDRDAAVQWEDVTDAKGNTRAGLKTKITRNIQKDKKLSAAKKANYIAILQRERGGKPVFLVHLLKNARYMEIWQKYSPFKVGRSEARTQRPSDPSQSWTSLTEEVSQERRDPTRIKLSLQRIAGMKAVIRGMPAAGRLDDLLKLSRFQGWIGEEAKDVMMKSMEGKKVSNPRKALGTDALMDGIASATPRKKVRVRRRKKRT